MAGVSRVDADPGPLLRAQRTRFEQIIERLRDAVDDADGFDQTVLRWRLETVTAGLRFIDGLLEAPASPGPRHANTQAGSGW